MKRLTIRTAFAALTLLLGTQVTRTASAADRVLAEVAFARSFGAHILISQGFMQLCGGLPEGCNPALRVRFPAMTNASSGSTVWVDSATPNFDALANLISNGVRDPFSALFEAGAGAGWFGFEPDFFGPDVGPSGVDLAGFVVHRVGYRVDAISFVSPGRDLAHDGIWTDASVDGSFLFVGTCAELPLIETLRPITVGTCGTSATLILTPPKAGSSCNDDPTVTGVVLAKPKPIPVVDGRITLPIGVHTLTWTVDDGYNTVTSVQTITVASKRRGRLCLP